jgi:hypothetical protein
MSSNIPSEGLSSSPESYGLSFEFLYGTVAGRLQEALALQAANPRYKHVWIERFPHLKGDFASFTLTNNYEELIHQGGEQFDVAISVTDVILDEAKVLADVKVAEGTDAILVFSTSPYDIRHRYHVTPHNMEAIGNMTEPELTDVEGKLLTYDIVPFRIQKETA